MATVIRLGGTLPAINMDYVVEVERTPAGAELLLRMHDGSAKILTDSWAIRVETWLAENAALPALTWPDP